MENKTPSSPTTSVAFLAESCFAFPAAFEHQILERLSLLDLEGSARCLKEVSATLGRVRRVELKEASLYAFDLLSTINRLVWRGTAEEAPRAANREILVRAFSSISRPADLRRVFEEMAATILTPFRGMRPGQHPAIPRAKAFIQESYHRKISLREVAAHLGLSRTYLSSLFRRECGCTLTEYLHRVRLQRAQELIRDGAPALSTVAFQVGYQNYRDFHRNFVRYQNASPKRFKRTLALRGPAVGSSPERV